MPACAASSNLRPCAAAARSIKIGEPPPTMRRTSLLANGLQPYSSIVRFSANAMSATVSSKVPSRSNSTADRGCPRQRAAADLCIDTDADRTVIAAHDARMYLGALHGGAHFFRYENIVDSPPDVARPRIGKMAPPRVVPIALREHAERIDEARVHEILESGALLVRESLLAAIGLGIGQVELGVRHIQIAAENDRLLLFQLLAIGEKGRIPVFETQRQAAEVILGVWRVDRHHVEPVELRRHDPAFLGGVALQLVGKGEARRECFGKTVDHGQRFLLGEDRRARIALLHGGIPILAIIGQVDLELPALGLGLLQTDDVGPVFVKKRLEYSLFEHRPNTVDVPGKNLHGKSLI